MNNKDDGFNAIGSVNTKLFVTVVVVGRKSIWYEQAVAYPAHVHIHAGGIAATVGISDCY